MKYRSDIDGLRSVAVIPVILFHMGFSWISGGYFGVDVFFVISGFLITSILYNKISEDSFSMKNFWLRRVNRILPAIITVILTTLLVAYLFAFNGDLGLIATDALSALFSYGNFHMWLSFGDYWGASAENSFFLHSWSLSVEEQFYFFYPLVLLFLFRKKISISKWLITIIVVSLLLFLYGSKYHPTATFYLLPTRAWELASGGLLAMVLNKKGGLTKINDKVKSNLAMLGLVLILSSYFVFTGKEVGYNFSAILPVLGTVLIIAFSSSVNFIGKILSIKPIVYIGKISYSLYLWHWPILVFLKSYYFYKLTHSEIIIISVISMTVLSVLSYNLIENKTRKWKHTPKLVLCLVPMVLVMTFFLKSSLVNKIYDIPFNKVKSYGYYYNILPSVYDDLNNVEKKNVHPRRLGTISPNPEEKNQNAYKNKGVITSTIKGNPSIMLIGDSHGGMWTKTIDEIAHDINLKASFYTTNGVSPFFDVNNLENQKSIRTFNKDQRILYAKSIDSNLRNWSPDVLILICRWNSLDEKTFQRMENLVELSKELGIKVLIINQPPQINTIGDRNSSQFLTYLGYEPMQGLQYIKHESNVEETNLILKKRFSRFSNVSFFDTYSNLIYDNDESKALIIRDSDILYYDDDHLSYQGTSLFKSELKSFFMNLIDED